jgi:hypothetical protein
MLVGAAQGKAERFQDCPTLGSRENIIEVLKVLFRLENLAITRFTFRRERFCIKGWDALLFTDSVIQ